MTLISLIVVIVIAGILLWGLTKLPIDATLRKILWVLVIVVVAILVVLYVASIFGYRPNIHLP